MPVFKVNEFKDKFCSNGNRRSIKLSKLSFVFRCLVFEIVKEIRVKFLYV